MPSPEELSEQSRADGQPLITEPVESGFVAERAAAEVEAVVRQADEYDRQMSRDHAAGVQVKDAAPSQAALRQLKVEARRLHTVFKRRFDQIMRIGLATAQLATEGQLPRSETVQRLLETIADDIRHQQIDRALQAWDTLTVAEQQPQAKAVVQLCIEQWTQTVPLPTNVIDINAVRQRQDAAKAWVKPLLQRRTLEFAYRDFGEKQLNTRLFTPAESFLLKQPAATYDGLARFTPAEQTTIAQSWQKDRAINWPAILTDPAVTDIAEVLWEFDLHTYQPDLDLYPDPIDKALMQVLLEYGNKPVGAVAAKLYIQAQQPDRAPAMTADQQPWVALRVQQKHVIM